MSIFFADTSAIVKQYLQEVGSAWVRTWASRSSGNVVILSRLTAVEFVSALARRQRQGNLSTADFIALRGAFLSDMDQFYITVHLEESVLIRARGLVSLYSLRALDALQLASALEGIHILGEPLTFITADIDLLKAATAEGLLTDDPNAHP